MESGADEVVFDCDDYRIYRSGKMDRLCRPARAPTGLDPATGVTSKDVVLDSGTGVSVRLFLPTSRDPSNKLPILVFFHGGGFLVESAVSPQYHNYVASLAAAAASAQDEWLAEHGDSARLFLAGDSAGGNIVHNVLIRASFQPAPRIEGAILLHPWFGGNTIVEGEVEATAKDMAMIWEFACPGAVGGADDPRMNPLAPDAPGLENLRCERMLACAGEKDWLAARDRAYYAAVTTSAWRGSVWRGGVAWFESEGEGHVFFLQKPDCPKTKELMARVVAFIAGA